MRYHTTKAAFLIGITLMSFMNFSFILLIYSIHMVLLRAFIDIVVVAIALAFSKRMYGMLFLTAAMLLEISYPLRHTEFHWVQCIYIGFYIFPKLVGYLTAYVKNKA